jgi:hypothetical protein
MLNVVKMLLPDPATGKMTTRPIRYNGRCKACGFKASFLAIGQVERARANIYRGNTSTMYLDAKGQELEFDNSFLIVPHACPGNFSGRIRLTAVFGTYNSERECNGKCMSAIGNVCECQCGGKNHGGSYG